MFSLKRIAALALAICLSPAISAAPKNQVSLRSLIAEMSDRSSIARYPVPAYELRQVSSHDTSKRDPGDAATWHSNKDYEQFIRTEVNSGRKEWVIMDEDGPGAICRFWLPLNPDRDRQIIRIYLDGSRVPALEAPFNDLLSGRSIVKPPLAFAAFNDSDPATQLTRRSTTTRGVAGDLYLPIPFSKHCKITLDQLPFYYIVNYRKYEQGTAVRTFSLEQLNALEPTKSSLQSALHGPNLLGILNRTGNTNPTVEHIEIPPGQSHQFSLPAGPHVVNLLELQMEPQVSPDAARSSVIEAEFDGEKTVWCPLSELAGSGVRRTNVWDIYQYASKEGVFGCTFPMPYRSGAKITIHNLANDPIKFGWYVSVKPWNWDARSMHFHAGWRYGGELKTRPYSDWNYVEIKGKGVYAGDTLTVYSPVGEWYGEGDERIYLNGATFPAHIGTGTEDYYGYAWGMADYFSSPWLSCPAREIPDRGDWRGYTTTSRMRILDAIPVTTGLKVDMEIWNWADTKVDYAVGVFWYAFPGVSGNTSPQPDAAKLPIHPKQKGHSDLSRMIDGAIEFEDAEISARNAGLGTEVQNAGLKEGGWSNGKQLFVKFTKQDETIELKIPATGTAERHVLLYLTQSFDYGILHFELNGTRSNTEFDGYSAIPRSTGPIDIGSAVPVGGAIRIKVTATGINPKAVPGKLYAGLDCVVLK